MDLTITPQVAALVPAVMALTSLIKIYVGEYYAPIVSLLFGIGMAFLVPQDTHNATVLTGIIVGTMAAGFYSGAKKLVN